MQGKESEGTKCVEIQDMAKVVIFVCLVAVARWPEGGTARQPDGLGRRRRRRWMTTNTRAGREARVLLICYINTEIESSTRRQQTVQT